MIDSMAKNPPHAKGGNPVSATPIAPAPAPGHTAVVSTLVDSTHNPNHHAIVIPATSGGAASASAIDKLPPSQPVVHTEKHTPSIVNEIETTGVRGVGGTAISEGETDDAGTDPGSAAEVSDQGRTPERGRRGRGRPPGRRNRDAQSARKRKRVDRADRADANDERDDGREEAKEEGRGAAFSPDEVLSICKAWSLLSSNSVMKTDRMWTQIAQICTERYGVQRSPGSLRVKWHAVQREVQIWLASKKRVQKNAPLGMTGEKAMSLVMSLYRQYAGKKDKNGETQQAPPFRYQKAAEFLEACPEFVALCVEGPYTEITEDASAPEVQAVQRQQVADVDAVEEQPPELIGNRRDGPSHGRPPSTKSQKRDAVRVREEEKSVQILTRIHEEMVRTNDVIERVDRRQEMCRRTEEDYMLLQVLPRDGPEYKKILVSMMARREHRDGDVDLSPIGDSNGHGSPARGEPSRGGTASQGDG